MTNKELQKEIVKLYQTVFLDLSNFDNFIFEDTRTYGNYDDYIDNYYISPPYRLAESDGEFRFYIKKHWFNLRVEVRTEPDVKGDNYDRRFNIYRDTLHSKRKNSIKDRIHDITEFVDYNLIMKKVQGNKSFARKMKLKKIQKSI